MRDSLSASTDTDAAREFVTQSVDLKGIEEIRDAWKALAGRAIEPNVFYDPDFALPVIGALEFSDSIQAVLVWHAPANTGRRLTGFFPFLMRRRWGIPVRVGEALIHPYAMSSAPLVDADAAEGTMQAFCNWLETGEDAPSAWLFRFLLKEGELYTHIVAQTDAAGAVVRPWGEQGRAVLDTANLDAVKLNGAMSTKRRKEFGRIRRRLEDRGSVKLSRATAPSEVGAEIDEFLKLEASGWKGRMGTAAADSPATARMFKEIGAGLSVGGQIRVDALRHNDVPIAMTISCGEGSRWWLWKIAYDETYARFSPGVLLTLELTEAAIRAGSAEFFDSCALPGHPMIERIWRQRRTYTDVLIVPGRLGRVMGAGIVALEAGRREAEHLARRMRNFVRRE